MLTRDVPPADTVSERAKRACHRAVPALSVTIAIRNDGELDCFRLACGLKQDEGMTPEKPLAHDTTISEIMTTEVVCVSPETRVDALTAMMLEQGFSGAPVIDAAGKPIGVVSKTDVLRGMTRGGSQVVAEIMTPVAFTLSEHATIAEAAALMAFEGTHRVPATAHNGAIVGIVSTIDVLRWIAETEGYLVGRSVRR